MSENFNAKKLIIVHLKMKSQMYQIVNTRRKLHSRFP